jgi:hypothetical protein
VAANGQSGRAGGGDLGSPRSAQPGAVCRCALERKAGNGPQKKQKKTGETLPAGFGDLFFDFRQQSVQLLFA